MNEPNSQATMTVCTRRSRETSMKPRRIVAAAPLSLSVKSKTIAPKMMYSSVRAMTTPRRLAPMAWMNGTFQKNNAKISVMP